MKLYIVNGTYLGTQAEAKAMKRELGLGAFVPEMHQVEVPTDKEGLIAYLNKVAAPEPLRYGAFDKTTGEPQERKVITTPAEEQSFAAKAIAKMDNYQPKPLAQDDLVEAILEADSFQLSNLIGACVERLDRLRKNFDLMS